MDERTHDLVQLLEYCLPVDPSFETLRDSAIVLTDYPVETRYPDDWRDISLREAEEAV